MRKLIPVLLLTLWLLPASTEAQRVRARWKAYRYEWSFGLGVSNVLSDLGGANQIGTDGLKDLEMKLTRPAVSVGFRYKLSQIFSIHTHATWGHVAGDDKLTEEFFRNNRNLNFKTDIFELNVNAEAALLSQKEGGIYRLKGVRRNKSFEASLYAFAGIGVFYFNPKGQLDGSNDWVRLQPLGTEGQGLSPAREKYSLTQICIPVGFGGRYYWNRRWGVGLEFGMRKIFTDYLDDVSKTYYDNDAILQAYGPTAAAFADPSLGLSEDQTVAGEQRGDATDKDAYMFAIISIHYKIRTGRTSYPIF